MGWSSKTPLDNSFESEGLIEDLSIGLEFPRRVDFQAWSVSARSALQRSLLCAQPTLVRSAACGLRSARVSAPCVDQHERPIAALYHIHGRRSAASPKQTLSVCPTEIVPIVIHRRRTSDSLLLVADDQSRHQPEIKGMRLVPFSLFLPRQ